MRLNLFLMSWQAICQAQADKEAAQAQAAEHVAEVERLKQQLAQGH